MPPLMRVANSSWDELRPSPWCLLAGFDGMGEARPLMSQNAEDAVLLRGMLHDRRRGTGGIICCVVMRRLVAWPTMALHQPLTAAGEHTARRWSRRGAAMPTARWQPRVAPCAAPLSILGATTDDRIRLEQPAAGETRHPP